MTPAWLVVFCLRLKCRARNLQITKFMRERLNFDLQFPLGVEAICIWHEGEHAFEKWQTVIHLLSCEIDTM